MQLLFHVIEEEGHIGNGWTRNKDTSLNCLEIPVKCIKCGTPWPCPPIIYARGEGKRNRGMKQE